MFLSLEGGFIIECGAFIQGKGVGFLKFEVMLYLLFIQTATHFKFLFVHFWFAHYSIFYLIFLCGHCLGLCLGLNFCFATGLI